MGNQRKATTILPYTELEVADGNFDTSRSPIDRIIIHTMVGTWQGAAARFDDPASKVSAHYGVKLDGTLIHWLEEYNTAYHAGDYPMNQRSIGIEHEDGGDYNGTRPDVLYITSAKLVRDICQFYSIPIDRQHILKHSEVSDNPTGCPDALDIERIVREAQVDPCGDKEKYYALWQSDEATITNLNNLTKQKDAAISTLNEKLTGLTTQLESKDMTIQTLQDQANKIVPLANQLDQAVNDKNNCIAAQVGQQKKITELSQTSYMTTPLWDIIKYKIKAKW